MLCQAMTADEIQRAVRKIGIFICLSSGMESALEHTGQLSSSSAFKQELKTVFVKATFTADPTFCHLPKHCHMPVMMTMMTADY